MIKTYSKLIELPTFRERFEYLKLDGRVGEATFGSKRYLNQALYHSDEWSDIRDQIIIRDEGCDLGMDGYDIGGLIYIHHINPITSEDIVKRRSCIFDPENLICVSYNTHQAIHYGDENLLDNYRIVARTPRDTILW